MALAAIGSHLRSDDVSAIGAITDGAAPAPGATVGNGDIIIYSASATIADGGPPGVISITVPFFSEITVTSNSCVASGGVLLIVGQMYDCTYGTTGAKTFTVTVTVDSQVNCFADFNADYTLDAVDRNGVAAQVAGFHVVSTPCLTVTKVVANPVIPAGGPLAAIYTINIANADPDTNATGVAISDTLNAQLNIISATTTSGTSACPIVGQTVTCTGLTVPAAGNIDIDITVVAQPNIPNGTVFNNSPTATSANEISNTVAAPAAVPITIMGDLPNGLYHIDPFGNPDIGRRDEQRNIVGYQHTVCLDDDEGLDIFGNPIEGAINADTDGVNDIDLDSVFPLNADDDKRWRIDTVAGSADLRGVNLHTMDIDGDSIFEECISWYSGNPGEQDVTIIDEEGEIIADWADGSTTAGDNVTTDCDLSDTGPVTLGTIFGPGDFSSIQGTDDCESIGPATPLVKEWNIFDHTDITEFGGLTTLYSTTLPAGPASTFVNWGVTFNPATSTFTTPLPGVGFDEHVLGTHASLLPNSGDFHNLNVTHVVGAEVTFSVSGTCGQVTIDAVPGGVTAIPGGPTTVVANGNDVTVTSVGVPIDFWFQTNNCTQQNNSWTKVTITVGYPNVINSNSHFVPGPEMVRVNWVPAPTPAKQVFLAWADSASSSSTTGVCLQATSRSRVAMRTRAGSAPSATTLM